MRTVGWWGGGWRVGGLEGGGGGELEGGASSPPQSSPDSQVNGTCFPSAGVLGRPQLPVPSPPSPAAAKYSGLGWAAGLRTSPGVQGRGKQRLIIGVSVLSFAG